MQKQKSLADIEDYRERGVWADNTTNDMRYESYAQEIVERIEDGYFDGGSISMADVGSSVGEALYGLAAAVEYHTGRETETTAIDVDGEALRAAAYMKNSDRAIRASAQELPLEDDLYDIVVSKTLLSRLNTADQSAAMREIERVARPDGLVAVEFDPRGRKGIVTGKSRVFTADEFGRLKEETGGFEDYPFNI